MATSTIPQINNESGTGYCKMPDGTMIQWGFFKVNVSANGWAEYHLSFPTPFTNTPGVAAIPVVWSDPKSVSVIQKALFQVSGDLRVGNTLATAQDVTVNWIAVGRWK